MMARAAAPSATTDTPEVLAPVDVTKPQPDDEAYLSVTTVIGVLDKPALVPWAAGMTADAAIRMAKTLQQRTDEVKRQLVGARFARQRGKRSATELGTAVHAACEEYALTGQRPEVDDEVLPFLDRFDEWAQEFQPVYQAAELTVYSPRFLYAGTCDAFLSIDGMPLIVDYKTTAKTHDARGNETGPYPEVGLQLAAYRHAEFAATWRPRKFEKYSRRTYLLGPDEREMAVAVPEVQGGLVIHITPTHCRAFPVRCDEAVFEHFLDCIELTRWTEMAKDVIGAPLTKGTA